MYRFQIFCEEAFNAKVQGRSRERGSGGAGKREDQSLIRRGWVSQPTGSMRKGSGLHLAPAGRYVYRRAISPVTKAPDDVKRET